MNTPDAYRWISLPARCASRLLTYADGDQQCTAQEGRRQAHVSRNSLSIEYGISVFDAAFADLSLRTGLTLLTSDIRLVRAVAAQPLSTELLEGV